jgi:Icc-related predicted phosphoesterase
MEDNKIIRMFDEIINKRYYDDLTNNINKIYEDFYNDNLLSYGDAIEFFKVLKDDDEEGNQEAYNNFDYKEITNIDVDTCQTINIPSFVTNLNPTKFIDFKNLKELFIENGGNKYLSQSNNTLSKIYLAR